MLFAFLRRLPSGLVAFRRRTTDTKRESALRLLSGHVSVLPGSCSSRASPDSCPALRSMSSYSELVYDCIKVETSGHVGIVTLSRPEAHNAWTEHMRDELIDIYTKFEGDPNIRVSVLTGDPAGKVFCAGADLSLGDFSSQSGRNTPTTETQARDGGGRFALTTYKSRKITIAAINGSAAGVGITQTLPMDLRFAWADAKIVFPFTRRAIVPEATSTYFLPQLIGRSRALAILLQASPNLLASSPLLSGLFAHLLPNKEDVLPYALKVAHELAENTSPASVAFTKSLTLHAKDTPEEQHLFDSRAMHVLGNGHDGKEGVKAFLEKREPKFQNFDVGDLPGWLPQPRGVREKIAHAIEGMLDWTKAKL